jgi:hypothetical protein
MEGLGRPCAAHKTSTLLPLVLLLLLLRCQCPRSITSRHCVAHLVIRDADLHPLTRAGPELAIELQLADRVDSITYLADNEIGLSPARHATSKSAQGPPHL